MLSKMDMNTRNSSVRTNAKVNHYIIVSESSDTVDWPTREAVRDALVEKYPESISKLIVAKEDFNSGKGIIFKLLIKFDQAMTSFSVKQSLIDKQLFVNKDWCFDTETARNLSVAVSECTKFDFDCVHAGHNRDRFHSLWKEENLCVRHMGDEWNPSHPVVAETAAKGKASLDSLHRRWTHNKESKIKLIKRQKIVNRYQGWQGEFIDKWNEAIDTLARGDKPKQFYIWGDSGCYKTSFIQYILGRFQCLNFFVFCVYY